MPWECHTKEMQFSSLLSGNIFIVTVSAANILHLVLRLIIMVNILYNDNNYNNRYEIK